MGGGMGAGVVCLLVAASLARADTVVPAPALPALEIMALDEYYDTQLPAHYRRGWWAVCDGRLRPVEVLGRRTANKMAPATRLSAAPCADAPFLLRAAGLGERTLTNAMLASSGDRDAKIVRATMGSRVAKLSLRGGHDDYWLELTTDGGQQRFSLGSDTGDWQVLWAGDLNGDSQPDFVIRVNGDGETVMLLLSRAGRRYRRAATTFFGGC